MKFLCSFHFLYIAHKRFQLNFITNFYMNRLNKQAHLQSLSLSIRWKSEKFSKEKKLKN